MMLIGHMLAASDVVADASAGHGEIDIFRIVLALGFCLALGIAAAFLLKARYRPRTGQSKRDLHVVQSVRVDSRTSVHLVRCAGRDALIACGPTGIALSPWPSKDAASDEHKTIPQDASP